MLRRIGSFLVVALLMAQPAFAHFLFVVPDAKAPGKASVILSEDLTPDPDVEIGILKDAKLFARDVAGHKPSPVTFTKAGDAYSIDLPRTPGVVYGMADLGVKQRGEGKPYVLLYYPKTIVGDAFDAKATLGADVSPVEIVPHGKAGALVLQVMANGRPLAKADVNLILPDGKAKKVPTDEQGRTAPLNEVGRYGAWARFFEPATGESGGKRYEEARRYATLVIDVNAAPAAQAAPAADKADVKVVEGAAAAKVGTRFAAMPQAASSFGAVACDGWLYVYGGHVAKVHTYSTEAVSGRFHRLNLTDGKTWEELPGGPAVQGMNLATHGGKVYRVGGMQPRNKPGEKADNYSIADVARFDPATKAWEALPPLPMPRSSHDVAVVGDTLVVLGGWNMEGRKGGNDWLGNFVTMDLSAEKLEWRTHKQPFERRALIVAAKAGKVYVIGGFDEESDPSRRVDVLDVKAGTWASGPELPGNARNGFSPAACVHGGEVYVSVADGGLYRLDETASAWAKVATTTPRIVHRMASHGGELLVIGGAAKMENVSLIENVTVGGDAAAAAR